jgi:hypothetical protein
MNSPTQNFKFLDWFKPKVGYAIPIVYQTPTFANNYSADYRALLYISAVGDFNGDNLDDVVVIPTDSLSAPIFLFSLGDGTFKEDAKFIGDASRLFIRNASIADINNDGRMDFIGFEANHTVRNQRDLILINNGENSFNVIPPLIVGEAGHHGGSVGDLNGDGRLDIFGVREAGTPNYSGPDPRSPIIQQQDGTFKIDNQTTPEFLERFSISAVAIDDINGDGVIDIAMTLARTPYAGVGGQALTFETISESPILAVALGQKGLPWSQWSFQLVGRHWITKEVYDELISRFGPMTSSAQAGGNSISVLDLNDDGKKEIIVGSYITEGFSQRGGGFQVFSEINDSFQDITNRYFPDQNANRNLDTGFAFSYHLLDINYDGEKDFIIKANGQTSWPEASKYKTSNTIFIGDSGSFYPAPLTDLRAFEDPVIGPYNIVFVSPGDLNGDGAPDLISYRNESDFYSIDPKKDGYIIATHLNTAIQKHPEFEKTIFGTHLNDQISTTSVNNIIRGLAGDDRIMGLENQTDTALYYGSTKDFKLVFQNGYIVLYDKFGNEGIDTLYSIERISFSDRTINVTSKNHSSFRDVPDSLYQFFVVGFGAAPGVTYMDQMAEAYQFWLPEYKENTIKQIVDVFTTKIQFTSVYPQALYREEGGKYFAYSHDEKQASKPLTKAAEVSKATFDAQMASLALNLVDTIVKGSASAQAKSSAVAEVQAALALGGDWTIGKVIYTVFGNLANKPLTDPTWGATAKQFANQVAVAKYYTEVLNQSTDDVATLRSVMKAVSSNTDVSTPDSIATLIGVALLGDPGG